MPDPLVERVATLLGTPDSPLRAEAARHCVEQLLSTRLREAVDVDDFIPLVLRTLSDANIARAVERHVRPGFMRFTGHVSAASEPIGSLVSEEAERGLRAALTAPVNIRGRWLKGAVDPKLIQRLLAPIWVQLFVSFARRIPIPGLAGAAAGAGGTGAAQTGRGGLAGMLGRGVQQSAERLVDAGRSALGGLGIDLETKLTAAARDFSDSALGIWNKALRERLDSHEGQAIVAQIKLGVLEHILRVPLRDLHDDSAGLAQARYFDVVPALVAHAVRVPFVKNIVEREIREYVAVEGDRRLDELLGELGMLDDVRTWLEQRIERGLGVYAGSDAFADWLGRVLDAARSTP